MRDAIKWGLVLGVVLAASSAWAGGGGAPPAGAGGGGGGPEPEVYAMALFSLLPGFYFARRAMNGNRRAPSAD